MSRIVNSVGDVGHVVVVVVLVVFPSDTLNVTRENLALTFNLLQELRDALQN